MLAFYGEIGYNLGSVSPIKVVNGRASNTPFVTSDNGGRQ